MASIVSNISGMVVTYHHPTAPASEAFRVLRTNLQFKGLDSPLRSILITSASPGEGKSTTSANLAVAIAQTGARVCLIDADLRRPTLAKLFGLNNWTGLTTAILATDELDDCIVDSGVPGLSVITSGPIPPNPAELLGSSRMTAILSKLETAYDILIIDSPPVLAVTDAAVLSPKVSGVLLTVRSGAVSRVQVQRAKTALEAVGARLLGVVLGAVDWEGKNGYYYYYYHSHTRS